MATVAKEIMNLARKAGYEGEDKTNVTKAIDALADMLAGENLEQATNVAAAIRKLQPYVGSGGGATWGVPTVVKFDTDNDLLYPNIWVYDKAFPVAQDDPCFGIFFSKNYNMAFVPSGLYLLIILDGSFEITGMTLDGVAFTDYTEQSGMIELQVPVSADQNKGLVIAVHTSQ